MNMTRVFRTLAAPLLLATLAFTGTALAQDKASEHDAHAAKAQEGSKMMMDGCDMMKMDMDKGAMMMGEGHAKMMVGLKGMTKMDGKQKMKMMAADKKMMQGKKMMMDGMKMMMQGKEEMAKTQQGAAGPDAGKHDAKQ